MQKVYKMPVLYSFYNDGDIRMAVTDEAAEAMQRIYTRNTHTLGK